MEWTDEDKATLVAFKDQIDCDDIKVKEKIKQVILNNKYLIHVLNNKELEDVEAEADEYFNENIYPYYMLPKAQDDAKNFICYEVSYDTLDRYNNSVKQLEIIFHILCPYFSIIDKETGIARHDLLAAILQDEFNFSNYFGREIRLVSDQPSTTDTNYATRALVFQQITDNNMVKTKKGTAMLANKDIIY